MAKPPAQQKVAFYLFCFLDATQKIDCLFLPREGTLCENIGLMKYEEVFSVIAAAHYTKPISDENITVIDTNFSDIPVRLYLPKRKSERQRPAVIYIHGGIFVFGSCKMSTSDDLNRWTANKLGAVVVGIDYRLAPQYQFPTALEDCVFASKFFLQDKVLAEYGVDPSRICVMGDSSGGTLAAAVVQLATLFENTGIMKFEDLFFILMRIQNIEPFSDENLTVIDTDFSNIPVRLYLPKRKSERQRPAVIYIHGGAYVTGSFKMRPYDFVNRMTASRLDAVVVAPDYRLAPQYLFPAALEDCIFAIKFFLQDKVLEKYGVDPARICISGDSSGGALVGSVTQLLQDDPEYRNKIKTQAMIYPKLQIIDTWMPSYREYKDGPFLSRKLAIKVSIRYITEDEELPEAILRNEYMPEGSRDLFKFVNWSHFLPEKYKKNHVYREPILGTLNASYPVLLDSRLSPLLVNDSQLQKLPLTYIITSSSGANWKMMDICEFS
ncbi:Arylacetamide deacetylase-like 2 [Microtus ochrogaster]|uniref:Arylacetamide deacetylase-like 2 n=1 Tax=Microtus ochrogaster TaxID=79684 RepID=A0A8J6KSI4_MICOH|nr:Arylacetamide deacetylase-like 2 [Microtus ochrogaster]